MNLDLLRNENIIWSLYVLRQKHSKCMLKTILKLTRDFFNHVQYITGQIKGRSRQQITYLSIDLVAYCLALHFLFLSSFHVFTKS